jgi:hypothetical protein
MQFLKMEILCDHGGGMVQIKVHASNERYSATQDVYVCHPGGRCLLFFY